MIPFGRTGLLVAGALAVSACAGKVTSRTADAGGAADAAPIAGPDASARPGDSGVRPDAQANPVDGGTGNPPTDVLNPDYTTHWNPGILADVPTGAPLGPDRLPVRSASCAIVPAPSGDATAAIQGALDGCSGKHQVVQLAAGKYTVSQTLTVPSGVVLRGAGSDAATGTTIVLTNGGPVVAIGTLRDGVCYDSAFDRRQALTKDAPKETSAVTVVSAAGFKAGDLALVDQADTSDIEEGDCTFFKRVPHYSVSQRVEVAQVSGNTITLTSPLHFTFRTAQSAQISRMSAAATTWAGLESVLLQGGRPGAYNGQNAGGVDVSHAAYSWVKDVQIDGTTSGMGVRLGGTYRCVVRDSHVHNSYSYGFGQDNYGLVVSCGAADNLVEDNIARFMNKPLQFSNSGGGNVFGYNYADNAWSCDGNGDDGFQEAAVDCHCSFPHMELVEGNWAPHMAAPTTHGAAGYLTFFRNYASSQWSPSARSQSTSAIVWSQPFVAQYANVAAVQLDATDIKMTLVGNVLGSTSHAALGLPGDLGTTALTQGGAPATSQVFASSTGAGLPVLLIDQTTVAWSTLWLTGNFDTVNQEVMWNASPPTANLPVTARTLPPSLYYTAQPSWWPAGKPWPWVGPDVTPKVNSLPAKDRSDSFDYYVESDPSCILDCAASCCRVGPACSL